jgi:hypothetical protein
MAVLISYCFDLPSELLTALAQWHNESRRYTHAVDAWRALTQRSKDPSFSLATDALATADAPNFDSVLTLFVVNWLDDLALRERLNFAA